MNIRQLQYISTVAKNGLNVSATADSLFTSQPGVSKQIRQLEDELGVQIFERRGRQITRITEAGQAIIEQADRALEMRTGAGEEPIARALPGTPRARVRRVLALLKAERRARMRQRAPRSDHVSSTAPLSTVSAGPPVKPSRAR